MLNMRTRSARASPASASRWCSASASSALVLYTSPMCALAPLVVMASRTARKLAGCGRHDLRYHHGRGDEYTAWPPRRPAPRGSRPGRRGRLWSIRAVRTSRAGLSTRSTVAISAVTPTARPSVPSVGNREDQGGRALGQAGGHRAPVTAAGCDQPGLASGRAVNRAGADGNPVLVACGRAPRCPAGRIQGIRLPGILIRWRIDLAPASLPVPSPAGTAVPTVRSAPGAARAGPARSRERLSHSGSVVAGDQQYVKTHKKSGHAGSVATRTPISVPSHPICVPSGRRLRRASPDLLLAGSIDRVQANGPGDTAR